MNFIIRARAPADDGAIYELVKQAFKASPHASGDEQDLVVRLRRTSAYVPELSLVAEADGEIIGHIMFTQIKIGDETQLILAPLAVLPARQKQGVGKALILRGHDIAKRAGYGFSVLVGHPSYYPKFGYRAASAFGLTCAQPVPPECFMACDLQKSGRMLNAQMSIPAVFFDKEA